MDSRGEKVTHEDLSAFVQKTLSSLTAGGTSRERALLVTLSGDLGAGKTTFVQALAQEFGVEGSVQSPTYVLMKSYPVDPACAAALGISQIRLLIHIDLYRLERPEEASVLGLDIILNNPYALVCIEWPERAGTFLPAPDLALRFSSQDAGDGERYIEVV